MKTFAEALEELTAYDIKKGFDEFDRRERERLYPDVYGPSRPSDQTIGLRDGDLTKLVIRGFDEFDKRQTPPEPK